MPENDYTEQVPIQRESTAIKKPLLDTGQRKIKVKEDKQATEIAQQILSDARAKSNRTASGRFNTDYPLQAEHPELLVIPAAAEIKAAGLVPGMFRFAVGTITGNEIGKQSTNIGQRIDNKLGTSVFAPTFGLIGGLGGYAFGSGFTGNVLSRIPRRYSYGPTNERTYWTEDQTPKYNSNQLPGLNRRSYQSPTTSQLEIVPQEAYASDVPTGAQWKTSLRTTPAFAKKRLLATRNGTLEQKELLDNIVNANSILRNTRKDVRKYAPYLTEDYARKTFSYDIDLMRRNEAFRQLNDRYGINTDTKIYVPEKYPYLTGPQYRPLDPFTWRLKAPISKTIQVPLSELKIQKNINRLADLSLTRGWAKLPYEKPKIIDVLNEPENIFYEKKGGKIHIKKANRGKFTDYCGGKVTSECIARGKASSNPTIRKRATFAANARKWKHQNGGKIIPFWVHNILGGK